MSTDKQNSSQLNKLMSQFQKGRQLKRPGSIILVIVVPFLIAATCTLRPPATTEGVRQIVVRGLLDEIIDDFLIVTPFATLTPTPTATPTLTPTVVISPTVTGGGSGEEVAGAPGAGGAAPGGGPLPPAVNPSVAPLLTVTPPPTIALPSVTPLPSPTLLPSPTFALPPLPTVDPGGGGGGGGGSVLPPAPPTATPTPTDTPSPPMVSFNPVTYNIVETGSTVNVPITVVLNQPFGQTITVDYNTSNGSAFSPNDYQATSGTLIFSPGQVSQGFNVAVINDTNDDPDMETVNLTLSNPSTNATLGTSSATLTIVDDDVLPFINFDSPTYTTLESVSPVLTITLSHPSGKGVFFTYGPIGGGTATPGVDYSFGGGVAGFGPGPTGESVTIFSFIWSGLIDNDVPPETNITETVILELVNPPTNLQLGSQVTTTLVITDNAP